MTENDAEHLAFESYCKEKGLDRSMHPLHLLYLNPDTKKALDAFKAGWSSQIRAYNESECAKRGITIS